MAVAISPLPPRPGTNKKAMDSILRSVHGLVGFGYWFPLRPPKQRADRCKSIIKPKPVGIILHFCRFFSAHSGILLWKIRVIKSHLPSDVKKKRDRKKGNNRKKGKIGSVEYYIKGSAFDKRMVFV
jgi:hypothetical protein